MTFQVVVSFLVVGLRTFFWFRKTLSLGSSLFFLIRGVRCFLFYFIIAAAIWTPMLVGISTLVGGRLISWLEKVEDFAPLILLAFIITVWIIAKVLMNRATRAFEHKMESDAD